MEAMRKGTQWLPVAAAALLALALVLSGPSPLVEPRQRVLVELSLETQVAAATGIARQTTDALRAAATNRVQEIQSDFSHVGAGLAVGQAEVIGWNRGYEAPLAAVVAGWLTSPPHRAVLLDPSYARIGCAWQTDAEATTWLVCWFQIAAAPAPVVGPPRPPPIEPVVVVVLPPAVVLPNTATALE